MTHVGYPLAHRREGFTYGISDDRLAGLADTSVEDTVDEEEADLVGVRDISEGWVLVGCGHELAPLAELSVTSAVGLGCAGATGGFEPNIESTCEESLHGRWSSCHESACG